VILAGAALAAEPVRAKPPQYPDELPQGAPPQWCPVVASWDDRGRVVSASATCLGPFAREAVRVAQRWRFHEDGSGTATVVVPFVHPLHPLPYAAPESDRLGITGGPPPCHVVAKVGETGAVSEAAVSDPERCRFDPLPPVPGWGGQHGRCEGRFVLFGGRPRDWELSGCPATLRGRVVSFLEGRAWAVPGEPLAVTFDLWLDPPAPVPPGTVVSTDPQLGDYVVVAWVRAR
jgi:hypothetical protein